MCKYIVYKCIKYTASFGTQLTTKRSDKSTILTIKVLVILVVKASLLLKVVVFKGNGDFIGILILGC